MHSLNADRYFAGEIWFAEEPEPQRLVDALRPLAAAAKPRVIHATTPGGRLLRDRAYRWATVEQLASDPTVGTLSLSDADDGGHSCEISLFLRLNPDLAGNEQRPPSAWFAISNASVPAPIELASQALTTLAERELVLHGCLTVLDNVTQATSEFTGVGTSGRANSALFDRRRAHDWRFPRRAWTLCRRLYWKTLLGPTLAAAAGGADAARAAGALDLREIDGSLLFQAMPGPPRDSLDPEFLAATTSLRRWLWPHTFKNPLDAAGFEAEVGLPMPSPTLG